MRVCLLIGAGESGGHEGVVDYVDRLRELLAAEIECEVASLPGRGATGLRRLRRLGKRFDLFHVQLPCYGWRYSLLPALIPMALPTGAALVVTFHEWEYMHPLRRWLLGWLLARAARVVFVSSLVREQFLSEHPRWRPSSRVETIPIGVNVRFFEPDPDRTQSLRRRLLGEAADTKLLVQFGTVYEGKQPGRLLEAVALLREGGTDVRLALAGSFIETAEFSETGFRAQIGRLGLTDRVSLLGSIDDEEELACVMAAADAVVGLYSDGLSMRRSTFWYAAQFGVPILTTAPASSEEFSDRPDVLQYPGLRVVSIDGGADEAAQAVRRLPSYRFKPFEPLQAPSWQDIAARHVRMYRAIREARTSNPG